MCEPTASFAQVRDQELEDIAVRRQAALPESKDQHSARQAAGSLVGLALSGGGGRSASFGLGIIQSMYRAGVLRYVDYVSGVSGGGYLTATLSQSTSVDQQPVRGNSSSAATAVASGPGHNRRFPLAIQPDGKQPPLVRRIGRRLRSLRRPFEFFSRHLWGLVITNLFVISGLVAVASLAAYLMKLSSAPTIRQFLAELGLRNDVSRELAPAIFLLLLWLLAFFAGGRSRSINRPFRRLATGIYCLAVIALVLGIVNLLGTGDLDLSASERARLINDRASAWVAWGAALLKAGLGTLFAVALLPYLKLPSIIRSGLSPNPDFKERFFSSLVSFTFVCGIPLIIYFFLAQENVSGHQNRPENHVLSIPSVRDWSQFLSTVTESARIEEDRHSQWPPPIEFVWKAMVRVGMPFGTYVHAIIPASPGPHWIDRMAGSIDPELRFTFQQPHSIGALIWRATDLKQDHGQPPPEFATLLNHPLQEIAVLDQQIRKDDGAYRLIRRAFWAFGALWSRDSFFERLVQRRARCDQLRGAVIKQLNRRVLSNPALYLGIANLPADLQREGRLHLEAAEQLVRAAQPISGAPTFRTLGDLFPALSSNLGEIEGMLRFKANFAQHEDLASQLHAELLIYEASDALHKVRAFNFDLLVRGLNGEFDQRPRFIFPGLVSPQSVDSPIQSSLAEPLIWPLSNVFGHTTFEDDQQWRLRTAGWATLIFLIVGLLSNLNRSSIHGFYRDQLGRIWCQDGDQRLSALSPWKGGGPVPLWTGTFNRFEENECDAVKPRAMFQFSPRFCGTASTGYVKTDRYLDNQLTVAEVIAISGAAVTPVAHVSLLFRTFLTLMNFRSGQWLPIPGSQARFPRWAAPLRIFYDWKAHDPERRGHAFVTDGGHCENLGIAPLLQRRCHLIIAIDSGHDPESRFLDLGNLLRSSECDYGVRFRQVESGDLSFDVSNLVPVNQHTPAHVVLARIEYPTSPELPGSPKTGYLVYIKPSFTGDESAALRLYQKAQHQFPNDPTIDQFFDPDKFEAYRQLGEHIGDSVCRQLWRNGSLPGDGNSSESSDLFAWTPLHAQLQIRSFEQALDHLKAPIARIRQIAAHFIAKEVEKAPKNFIDLLEPPHSSRPDAANVTLPVSILGILYEFHDAETDPCARSWLAVAIRLIEEASEPRIEEEDRHKNPQSELTPQPAIPDRRDNQWVD